ncbi:MAG: glycosyltransferase involved in cell wall biosynthesis [Flavobacteriaceae bacterium]|jgi:glycosyltransferase involved in cell wall biosynthesis
MEKGKRILFLADINSVHTERWVKSLIDRGFEIHLFSLSARTTDWQDACQNFHFTCFGVDQSIVSSNQKYGKLSYFKARKDAKKMFLDVQPDVIHAHYASSYGMLARYIGFKHTVLSLWGSDVYEFPRRSILHSTLFKRAVRFPATVCSTSKDMALEATKWIKRNYIITPFGVDTDRFVLGEANTSKTLTLGTVKSLEEVYGIDRLIELYANFRKSYSGNSQLFIYGSGSQEELLKQQAIDLNIADHVHFKGFVGQEKLVEAFHSLDIFIALSRRESFGVAVLEAQACGVPVFVTNVGGLPEVTSPKTGTIVDDQQPESWTKHFLDMVEIVKESSSHQTSREFVLKNFSNEVCVDKIIQVYKDVQGI